MKMFIIFSPVVPATLDAFIKGWAELSKQYGCVNKRQEIKWTLSSEWLCDASLSW